MIAGLRRIFGRRRAVATTSEPAPDPEPAPAAELLERIEQLEGALGAVEATLASTAELHTAWLTNHEAGIGDIHSALSNQAQQLNDVSNWLTSTVTLVTAMSSVPVLPSPSLQAIAARDARPVDPVAILRHDQSVWQVMSWLALDPSERETLVSVIMPTRNRREYLERAVRSVLNQRHQRLELVVIDDGSTDSTPEFVETIEDPRVKVLHTTGLGEAAARNLGLASATGEVITYLDDDNLMHPGWLHAVAWAFDRLPDRHLLYGARLIEDASARAGSASGAMPNLEFIPFDRRRLEQANFIDMNTIAHRAGLPEAHFDESLQSVIDWELALVLTARYEPIELPVISCLYGTYASGRIADKPVRLDFARQVLAQVHTTRSMRILCHNELFPVAETSINEEMSALEAHGARIGFAASRESVSPHPIDQPLWHDLDEAIREHDPDLVFMYGVTHANRELPNLEYHGRPFAVRVHSFDLDSIRRLQEHPLCAGVWAYPRHAARLQGGHSLAPIFSSHASMPEPQPVRKVVLSVSAGLDGTNLPLLLDGMDQLQDIERWIVAARSPRDHQTADDLERLVAEREKPPKVRVNLPRADVFDLLSRGAAVLYTMHDGVEIGMPMSIVEAMRAGCCVIHADREELREMLGTSWRPYRAVEDIVRHVREVMAGGPAIVAERLANRTFATEHFCAPERGHRFHTEVSDAIEAWRMRAG